MKTLPIFNSYTLVMSACYHEDGKCYQKGRIWPYLEASGWVIKGQCHYTEVRWTKHSAVMGTSSLERKLFSDGLLDFMKIPSLLRNYMQCRSNRCVPPRRPIVMKKCLVDSTDSRYSTFGTMYGIVFPTNTAKLRKQSKRLLEQRLGKEKSCYIWRNCSPSPLFWRVKAISWYSESTIYVWKRYSRSLIRQYFSNGPFLKLLVSSTCLQR